VICSGMRSSAGCQTRPTRARKCYSQEAFAGPGSCCVPAGITGTSFSMNEMHERIRQLPQPGAGQGAAVCRRAWRCGADARFAWGCRRRSVQLTMVDLRWQMYSTAWQHRGGIPQGAFQEFRQRRDSARHGSGSPGEDEDAGPHYRGVRYRESCPRIADCRSIPARSEGAGRVEDTVNLLAHADGDRRLRADLLSMAARSVCTEAGIPLLAASSVKKALDLHVERPC